MADLRMPRHVTIDASGRLAYDLKLEHTTGGTATCRTRILVDQGKDYQGNEKPPMPFSLQLWGKTAERFCEHAAKGDPIRAWGSLEYEEWQDKDTGARRSKYTINVDGWEALAWDEQAGASERGSTPAPAAAEGAAPEDDIPF